MTKSNPKTEAKTETETITCCPECEDANIQRSAPDANWRCYACFETFDDPATREREVAGSRLSGLAQKLEQADPKDLLENWRESEGHPPNTCQRCGRATDKGKFCEACHIRIERRRARR